RPPSGVFIRSRIPSKSLRQTKERPTMKAAGPKQRGGGQAEIRAFPHSVENGFLVSHRGSRICGTHPESLYLSRFLGAGTCPASDHARASGRGSRPTRIP